MSRYIYAEYTNDDVKLYNIDRSRLVDNESNFDGVQLVDSLRIFGYEKGFHYSLLLQFFPKDLIVLL